MWRLFVLLGCVAALACGVFPGSSPDVILVTLDTTRADHLGVYGYQRDITPRLDGFARDAVTFRRAWSAGAWTLPAHASMLTGKQVSSHGARFDMSASNVALSDLLEGDFFEKHKASRLPDDEITLAELLIERGYVTAAFAGGPWLAPPFGLMQGYQVKDADVETVEGRSAEELTDRAIRWIEGVPRRQPLHLLVNYFDPHSPYAPPPGFDDLPGAKIPLDPAQSEIFVNGGRKLTKRQRRAVIDRYDGEIRYMDHHFGRLVDALKRSGRYDRALIIAVGDHGELFGEHGFMGHGRWLYESVARIPLLVRFPGGRGAGTSEEVPVSQVDLLPMVGSELSLDLPRGIDGLPIGSREQVLAEAFRDPFSVKSYGDRYDRDLSALVRWPWKLIATDTGHREFYRLNVDPFERRDRPGAEVARTLERALTEAVRSLTPRLETTPPTGVTPELRESLQELGYIE
jgi:arylsulfatase A-like enzyme